MVDRRHRAGRAVVTGWVEPHANVPRVGHALATWREKVVTEEKRAARERPTNDGQLVRGVVVDAARRPVLHTSTGRRLTRMSAVRRRLRSENHAGARRHFVPDTVDVLEIHGPDDWAQLCRRFPLEVTAQKRHDWYRTTGRDGKWVLPDWRAVAEVYGGVHLTVAGYLAAAGTAIDVDGDTASVIAGWAPDETFWLTDDVHADGDIVDWVRVTNTETWSEA